MRHATPTIWNRSLFDRLWSDVEAFRPETRTASSFRAALDAHEFEDRYLLSIDLPGMKSEDVEVEYAEGVLSIRGERKIETVEGAKELRRGRSAGSFHHRVAVGREVDVEHIAAEFRDGVLYVTIPKSENARPREIPVTVN